MKALIACEESQAVTIEFRKRGHEAYSCDILPCSGGHPEWHIEGDVLPLLTQDWDLVIAFPPCTDLAVSGVRWFPEKRANGSQQLAIDFFLQFTKLKCKWAIENPVGIMSSYYRKPDQIIHPYFFGDNNSKQTCLWLNKLPLLYHNDKPNLFDSTITHVDKGEMVTFESGRIMPKWYADAWGLPKKERAKLRSKTFPGIAQAMANQWL